MKYKITLATLAVVVFITPHFAFADDAVTGPSISGVVYQDVNGNGARDDGEPVVDQNAVGIYIDNIRANSSEADCAPTISYGPSTPNSDTLSGLDSNGNYLIDLALGSPLPLVDGNPAYPYCVTIRPEIFVNYDEVVTPTGEPFYNVLVSSDTAAANLNFAAILDAKVAGRDWVDQNFNTVQDKGEVGFTGRTITAMPITQKGGVENITAERAVKTVQVDSDGYFQFVFSAKEFGSWRITSDTPDGYYPSAFVTYDVTVGSGTDIDGNIFGYAPIVNFDDTTSDIAPADNGDGTFSGVLTDNATTTVSASSTVVSVTIAAGTRVTSDGPWDGKIALPTVTTEYTAPPSDASSTAVVTFALEVGSSTTRILFDKGVRIVFPGRAGNSVGWSRAGTFTEITDLCSADSQDAGNALADGADCKIPVDGDLVVWTKHFTTFLTYTQVPIPEMPIVVSSNGGGSIGAYSVWSAPENSTSTPQGLVLGVSTERLSTTSIPIYSSSTPQFAHYLTVGSRGADVTLLQKTLTSLGFYDRLVTGYFGPLTQAAVKAFQSANHIYSSGFVGPLTLAALNALSYGDH